MPADDRPVDEVSFQITFKERDVSLDSPEAAA